MLELDALPERLIIAGSGVIATEFAQIFARLGTKVTLVARGVHILSNVDHDAVAVIERALRRDGVRIMHGTKAARGPQEPARAGSSSSSSASTARSRPCTPTRCWSRPGRTPKVDGLDLAAGGHRARSDHRRPARRPRAAHDEPARVGDRRCAGPPAVHARREPRGAVRREERAAATRTSSPTSTTRCRAPSSAIPSSRPSACAPTRRPSAASTRSPAPTR